MRLPWVRYPYVQDLHVVQFDLQVAMGASAALIKYLGVISLTVSGLIH